MLGAIAMSCGLTAVMSLVFHGTVKVDMLVTGFVCALVIDRIINRISGQYRKQLAVANQLLEQRVRERTAALEASHRSEAALRDELMARDRMAAAGMLAAGVSHEIRSPLGVIVMAVEELLETESISDEGREIVADVQAAAAAIGTILKDLSSLARPVDDPMAPIALEGVVDSAARLAAYKLGPGVKLERGPLSVPPVIGNAPRLLQLLMNLIVNAARASRPDTPNVIRIGATLRGADRVVLAISDSGTGMSAETLARVFEPFFTTGRTTGGTGLGLPICRSIVERMGGTIEIESALGVGTTVSVALAVRASTAGASSARAGSATSPPR